MLLMETMIHDNDHSHVIVVQPWSNMAIDHDMAIDKKHKYKEIARSSGLSCHKYQIYCKNFPLT